MPYIKKEKVKEIRNAVKKAFPGFKFSVVRENYSSVNICVLEGGDAAFAKYDGKEENVNHFYIADHFKDDPVVRDVLLKIYEIASADQRELVYDGDYGSVPNYYVNIHIGRWDRPFKFIEN